MVSLTCNNIGPEGSMDTEISKNYMMVIYNVYVRLRVQCICET